MKFDYNWDSYLYSVLFKLKVVSIVLVIII